jgi:hypothetical protein
MRSKSFNCGNVQACKNYLRLLANLMGFLLKLNVLENYVGTWETLSTLMFENKFYVVGSSWEILKRPLQTLLVHIFTISKQIFLLGFLEDYG